MDKQVKIKGLTAAMLIAGLVGFGGVANAFNVNGGGATLPEQLYQEQFGNSTALPGATKITSASDTWTYVGDGSGAGRAAFLANDATRHGLAAGLPIHFGGSDAALTETELRAYIASTGLGRLGNAAGHGRMIQVPMMGTPVLVYVKSASGLPATITLTKSQLCKAFSGQATTWQQLDSTLPNVAFKVAYRSESSGTTTLLTQHLQAVCDTDSNITWSGNGTFANNFPSNTVPANFVPASGSGGIQTALDTPANTELITYLSPDPLYTPAATVQVARLVNRNNASAGGVDGTVAANVTAALNAALVAPAGTSVLAPVPNSTTIAPTNGYLAATNPAYPVNWVKLAQDPATGYPIVGTTNLVLSQCYVGARSGGPNTAETAIRNYLNAHYDDAAGRIGAHRFVPLPSTLVASIKAAFIDGTGVYGTNLQIGNPAYCNTVAGRNAS